MGSLTDCVQPAGRYTRGGYGSSPVSRLWMYSRNRMPPVGSVPAHSMRTVSSAAAPRATLSGAMRRTRTRSMAGRLSANESAGSASNANRSR